MKTPAQQLLEDLQADVGIAQRASDATHEALTKVDQLLDKGADILSSFELNKAVQDAGLNFAKLVAFGTGNTDLAASLVDSFRGMTTSSETEKSEAELFPPTEGSRPLEQNPSVGKDLAVEGTEIEKLERELEVLAKKKAKSPMESQYFKKVSDEYMKRRFGMSPGTHSFVPAGENVLSGPATSAEEPVSRLQSVNVDWESLNSLVKDLNLGEEFVLGEDAISNMSPEGVIELKNDLKKNIEQKAGAGKKLSMDDLKDWAKKRALQVKDILPAVIPTMLNLAPKYYDYFQKNYPSYLKAARNPNLTVDLTGPLLAVA